MRLLCLRNVLLYTHVITSKASVMPILSHALGFAWRLSFVRARTGTTVKGSSRQCADRVVVATVAF